MRRLMVALISAAILGAGAASSARADNFGWGLAFGALVAAPLIASSYWPYYYPPYYPAYPYYPPYAPNAYAPTYGAPYSAPAYVEQRPAQAASWYYCPSSNGYYPYVRECPGGWQQIPTTPPGGG